MQSASQQQTVAILMLSMGKVLDLGLTITPHLIHQRFEKTLILSNLKAEEFSLDGTWMTVMFKLESQCKIIVQMATTTLTQQWVIFKEYPSMMNQETTIGLSFH